MNRRQLFGFMAAALLTRASDSEPVTFVAGAAGGVDPSIIPRMHAIAEETSAQTKKDILDAFARAGLKTPQGKV